MTTTKRIYLSIALVLGFAIPQNAQAYSVEILQGLVIRDAQYMDKHGYNVVTAKQFIETCTTLQEFYCVNGFNWCTSGSLERRYIKLISQKQELQREYNVYNSKICYDSKTGRTWYKTRENSSS